MTAYSQTHPQTLHHMLVRAREAAGSPCREGGPTSGREHRHPEPAARCGIPKLTDEGEATLRSVSGQKFSPSRKDADPMLLLANDVIRALSETLDYKKLANQGLEAQHATIRGAISDMSATRKLHLKRPGFTGG